MVRQKQLRMGDAIPGYNTRLSSSSAPKEDSDRAICAQSQVLIEPSIDLVGSNKTCECLALRGQVLVESSVTPADSSPSRVGTKLG